MVFPSRMQYQVFEWGLIKLKVVANSIRASNIEVDMHDLNIDFLGQDSSVLEILKNATL